MTNDLSLFWLWAIFSLIICLMGWGTWKYLTYLYNNEDDDK